MENNLQQTPSAPIKTKNKASLGGVIGWILCILLLAATAGVYFWQHSQLTKALDQANQQKQQLTDNQSKIASLQKQLADLQKPAEPKATVAVNSAQRMSLLGDPNKNYVTINLTIKNTGTTALKLDTKDFTLKNEQNAAYQSYKDVLNGTVDNALIQQALPKGETLFTNQTLPAGDTITGTFVYYATDKTTSFNLNYNGTAYKVAIK